MSPLCSASASPSALPSRPRSTRLRESAPASCVSLVLLWSVAAGCGNGGGRAEPDAAIGDGGPYVSGELSCSSDVTSDYATRTYSFADGFDRRDLGPNWHTAAPDRWAVERETELAASWADGDDPGALAMVSDRQTGTEIVIWADAVKSDWSDAVWVACRTDGPPMTVGYGARILADRLEVFEQTGGGPATALATQAFVEPVPADARIRAVVGCTGQVITAFALGVGEDGSVTELGCATWRTEDAPRVGAVGLTHEGGRTIFDDVRVELDPP